MKEFEFVAEIIPNRLYFAICKRQQCPDMEGQQLMLYFNFFVRKIEKSFGPPNIGVVHEYITEVRTMLKKHPKRVIIHLGFTDEREITTNSAFLIGAFAIMDLKKDPAYVTKLLNAKNILMPFNDTTGIPNQPTVPMSNFFRALKIGTSLVQFLDIDDFNILEFDYLLHKLDTSWILPQKFLAFSTFEQYNSNFRLRSQRIIQYFKKNNVTTVIRLSEPLYDSRVFTDNGLKFHDIFFADCTAPSVDLVKKFLQIAEKTTGAIAVHCFAGLGRTGTMIACYLIKHYDFTALEATAWCRLCRYGSIIGLQHKFLQQHERVLKLMGLQYKRRNNFIPNHQHMSTLYAFPRLNDDDN